MPNQYTNPLNPLNQKYDLIGRKFGQLTVIKLADRQNRKRVWECQCECGNHTQSTTGDLFSGKRTSCGCGRRKHGLSFAPIYFVWTGMMQRCYNPNHKRFADWGGRGITVCDRWHTFKNFFADMGHPPSRHHSIDRLDNALGYFPENCHWATRDQQQRNTRQNVLRTYNNETKSIAEWAELFHLSYSTLQGRIQRGWNIEVALHASLNQRYKKFKQPPAP